MSDPLPPALYIPEPVADLRAVARATKLIVDFTPAALSTEGLALDGFREMELRIGPAGDRFDVDRWSWDAKKITLPNTSLQAVHAEIPASEWTGKEVVVAARLWGPRGRPSRWSNLVSVWILEPLPAPTGLRAESTAAGVRLEWQPVARRGVVFRVLRQAEGETQASLAARVDGLNWTDAAAEFGKRYTYRLQTVLGAGSGEAESELSAEASVTPEDKFPPPVPAGLNAMAGLGAVELSWDAVTASDLAGYVIFRARDGGALEPLGPAVTVANYSDKAVESGKRYRYAVAAVDLKGNQSQPAAAVEIIAP